MRWFEMKFGVVSNPQLRGTLETSKRIVDFLKAKGQNIQIEEKLAEKLGTSGSALEEIAADIIIAIGGDGTVLRTLQRARGKILAVNMGRVGFLTEVQPEDIEKRIEDVLAGNYIEDTRDLLKVELGGGRLFDCLNEVVIHTSEISKMRGFQVYVDKNDIGTFRADGLIVATATGSTCYSMSAGGPILDPGLDGVVIQPIAPFKISSRAYVASNSSRIRLMLQEEKQYIIVLDGQHDITVPGKADIIITKSERQCHFLRFSGDFHNRCLDKLYD
jgi:NAD+ kinase